MTRKSKRNSREPATTKAGVAMPEHVPTIIGDAVHNLRAALDHAYCTLVKLNGGTVTRHTLFPFGQDKQSLVGSINGHKANSAAPRVVAFILNHIQPYEGGKLGLYGLHMLDITDKHMSLIPTERVMQIERLDFTDTKGRLTGSGISNINLVISQQSRGTLLANTGGSIKLHGNPKKAIEICFGQKQPFAGQSVLQTLEALFNNVGTTLDALEREAT